MLVSKNLHSGYLNQTDPWMADFQAFVVVENGEEGSL